MQAVFGGFADEQGAVGQAGQEQSEPAEVEGGVGPGHLLGQSLAGPGGGQGPLGNDGHKDEPDVERHPDGAHGSLHRGGRHQATDDGGGRVFRMPVHPGGHGQGIAGAGGGGGGHGQGRRRPQAGATGMSERTVIESRSWPTTSMATLAARWVASAARSDPSPEARTVRRAAGSTSTST